MTDIIKIELEFHKGKSYETRFEFYIFKKYFNDLKTSEIKDSLIITIKEDKNVIVHDINRKRDLDELLHFISQKY